MKFSVVKITAMQDPSSNLSPHVALSHGDFNGIGYEIILKTFADSRMLEMLTPVLYGQSKAFSYYKKNFGLDAPNYVLTREARQSTQGKLNIINIVESELKIEPGTATALSAEMSMVSMKKALEAVLSGVVDALVMSPDSREVERSNIDFLLSHFKDADPLRLMVSDVMRIALATDDMPLASAIAKIDIRYVVDKILTLAHALKTDFGINMPKIAVLSPNPHASLVGDDKVVKAIGDVQHKGILAFGPFSTSQLFVEGQWQKYDAVLAMYYNQGVFPLKLMTSGGCACYWAGLPVVCAAPLHGAAFDIANLNKANPDAYRRALYLAADVIRHRKEQ